VKLNLGCGLAVKEGFVNVDRRALPGVDVVHDLSVAPWPWADGEVEEVVSYNALQQVADLPTFFNELWRVLAPGAKAEIHVPYLTSMRAWTNPANLHRFSEQAFLYTSRTYRESHGGDEIGYTCHFEPVEYGFVYHPLYAERAKDAREFMAKHYWNIVDTLAIWLTKA